MKAEQHETHQCGCGGRAAQYAQAPRLISVTERQRRGESDSPRRFSYFWSIKPLVRRMAASAVCRVGNIIVEAGAFAGCIQTGKGSGSPRCTIGNSDVQAQTGEVIRPVRVPA